MFADGEVFPDGRFTGQPAGGISGLLSISYSGANARARLIYPMPAYILALTTPSDTYLMLYSVSLACALNTTLQRARWCPERTALQVRTQSGE